jgi:hypothetical protein
MALSAIETSDEQQLQAQKGGTITYTRSWKVTSDTPGPNLYDVQGACGVALGDSGPGGTVCSSVRMQGTDSRYLYKVQAEYSKPDKQNKNPLEEADTFSWSFALSSAPAIVGLGDQPIINSAGDPLENVSMDVAEVRLKISGNRASFPAGFALDYVNCVNSGSYAGGAAKTWKCQGIEASSTTTTLDDGNGGEFQLTYWKTTIDLAYKAEGWKLKLLDVGYNELVSGKKLPIALPRVRESDTEDEKNAWRSQFRATDPQALKPDGSAKDAGEPPAVLEFEVYRSVNFSSAFPSPS